MVKMGQLFMQMDILMDKVMFLLKKPKMKCMKTTTLVFYAEDEVEEDEVKVENVMLNLDLIKNCNLQRDQTFTNFTFPRYCYF